MSLNTLLQADFQYTFDVMDKKWNFSILSGEVNADIYFHALCYVPCHQINKYTCLYCFFTMKSMKYMKILDVFVVMPNHVHGIIIINKTNGSADTTSATGNTDVETQNTDVETQNFASLLRIIRKEHYLLNQSRNIHLI